MFLLLLAGCGSHPSKDGPPRSGSLIPAGLPNDPVPRKEPRSQFGNGPVYRVNGHSYSVMKSSYGYRETGVASWYGRKFHGRLTASKEPYNMYAMTAAHKSLPLPTYVRVRNLKNNRSVVVRVNDRGPFIDNRVIDLSYSAAKKLDMISTGTSLVEITAISFDDPPVRPKAPARPPAPAPVASKVVSKAAETPPEPVSARESPVFVQVGAFGDPDNARRRYLLLRDSGVDGAFVLEDNSRSPALYRVRIGPIADVLQYDQLVARLQGLGISETHLVTD